MIKVVALIRRRSDLTREQFADYYEHQHAPLFHREIPPEVAGAIVRYVQNHAISLRRSSTEPAYDVVTEIGFDDLAGLHTWNRWYLGDGGRVLRDDEDTFMDKSKRVVIITEERNIGIVR